MNSEEFEYDGYLVFNSILKINRQDSPPLENSDVMEALPSFDIETSADQMGDGFEAVPLSNYQFDPELFADVSDFSDQVYRLMYKSTSPERIIGLDDNRNEIEIEVQTVDTVDCYLVSGEYILIRGSKSDVNTVSNKISESLDGIADTEELFLSRDFLLWLLYQYNSSDSRAGSIWLTEFTDAEFDNEESDNFGRVARVSGSTDILRSTPVLMSILRGTKISSLGGIFILEEANEIFADISEDGRIHIKANSGDIKDEPDIHRLIYSLRFVLEIAHLYYSWEELSGEDKYPPTEFFEQLYRECERQGAELTFSPEEVIEEYRKKRLEA